MPQIGHRGLRRNGGREVGQEPGEGEQQVRRVV